MPGLVGTTVGGERDELLSALCHEQWMETARLDSGDSGLGLIHHGKKDPGGWTVWEGDGGVGVVYGAISNQRRLDLDDDALFSRLRQKPSNVLAELDGPFALAALGRDGELLAATDKLATRPLYYVETDDGVAVSSELKALVPAVLDPELDDSAVGDLVSFGFVLGEKTLVRGVKSLPPASVLRYDGESLSVKRYWELSCGTLGARGYPRTVLSAYRTAMRDVSSTLAGDVGMFLSGGLDSRLLAAVLREEYGPFHTMTYDANPATGANIEPAREVADILGLSNELIKDEPGTYHDDVRRVVELTDGMTSWSYLLNLNHILHGLHDDVDIMFEGATQGELFGEQIWTCNLRGAPDAATALSWSFPHLSADRTSELLGTRVDPEQSIREAVAGSNQREQEHVVLDTWLRTFTANSHFRNKNVMRSQVGMRIPFAAGEFLDTIGKMPHESFRRTAFPGTHRKIPRSMAPLKRALILELEQSSLGDIPYERTLVAAKRPMWVHDATYVGKQVYWRFLKGRHMANLTTWSREIPETRQAIEGWLDDAASRELFDADALSALASAHFEGEANHLRTIAPITAVELFAKAHLD